MFGSWQADSDEDSSFPEQLYQKIKEKLGEANQIISTNKKADEEMPKLKLIIPVPTIIPNVQRVQIQSPKVMVLENPSINYIKTSNNKWDTLLRHFQGREKDLVYFRSDNRNQMKLETETKTINYFTGHFQDITYKNMKRQDKVLQAINPINNQKRKSSIQMRSAIFTANYPVIFDSCFQSGNLFAAFKSVDKNDEFDLVMQNDINSKGNTQWFHFKCRLPKGKFKFNILNYTKNDSLFNSGMKVSVSTANSRGWSKQGGQISYRNTNLHRQNSVQQYYTLSFSYTNLHESNWVTFANCYPISYSDILNKCQKHLNKKVTKITICNTYAGLQVFAIRIGELKSETCSSSFGNNRVKKKSLVFMARQHPGETPGSWVMEGVFDSLFTYKEFDVLKKMFVIYLIPIMNPDGVVYGNYRSNLSGSDLNRKWRHPNKHLHPEVYFTRRFLSEIHRENPIYMILDFHGHSKKLGSFFYGNPSIENGIDNRMFPHLCSIRSNRISYQDSTFSISEDKKNTARVVLNEMFPHTMVYTFEASFSGFLNDRRYDQFTIYEYRSIGRTILQSLTQLVGLKKQQTSHRLHILNQLPSQRKNDADDSGSDSEPEQNILEEIAEINRIRDQALKDQAINRGRSLIKKNVVLKKGMIQPKHTEVTMVDKATQTQRKYFTSERQSFEKRSNNRSLKQLSQSREQKQTKDTEAVLRILQLKSVSPDKQIFFPDTKKPYANQKKWETKKVKVFGSSFTMKLWNKGGNNLSFENKNENDVEFYKILSKTKPA